MVKEDSNGLAAELCAASQRDVIAFDNRGSGDSRLPPATIVRAAVITFEAMADDCAAVLMHWGSQSGAAAATIQAHVFGVSMGGHIAQIMALRYPRLVASLTLGCTHHGGPEHARVSREYRKLLVNEPPRGPSVAKWKAWLAYMHASLAINFAPGFDKNEPERFNRFLDSFVAVEIARPSGGKEAQMAAINRFNQRGVQAELKKLQNPVLIVHGEQDQVIPVENAALLCAALRNSKQHIFPTLGHMFWDEDCLAAVRVLDQFFLAHDGDSSGQSKL